MVSCGLIGLNVVSLIEQAVTDNGLKLTFTNSSIFSEKGIDSKTWVAIAIERQSEFHFADFDTIHVDGKELILCRTSSLKNCILLRKTPVSIITLTNVIISLTFDVI